MVLYKQQMEGKLLQNQGFKDRFLRCFDRLAMVFRRGSLSKTASQTNSSSLACLSDPNPRNRESSGAKVSHKQWQQRSLETQLTSATEETAMARSRSAKRSKRKKDKKRLQGPPITISSISQHSDTQSSTIENTLVEAFEDDRLHRAKSLCRSPNLTYLSNSSLNSPVSFQSSIIAIEDFDDIKDMPINSLPPMEASALLELQRISISRSPSPFANNSAQKSINMQETKRISQGEKSQELPPRMPVHPPLLLHQYQSQNLAAPSLTSLHRSNSVTSTKVLVDLSQPSIIRKGSLLDRSRSPSSSFTTMSGNGSGLERTLSRKRLSQAVTALSSTTFGECSSTREYSGDEGTTARSLSRKSTLKKSISDESYHYNTLSKKVSINDSVDTTSAVNDEALRNYSSLDRQLKRTKSTRSKKKQGREDVGDTHVEVKTGNGSRRNRKPQAPTSHNQESDDDIEDRIPLAFVRRL